MRTAFFTLTLFLNVLVVFGQNIGIGTASPNTSAILDISSSNKGLLLPRLTDTSSVPSPAKGLIIYNNANNKLWFYNGSRWQQAMATSGGMDSIWYKTKDTVAYTEKSYVGINTDLNLFEPKANLQVTGGILVQGKLDYTNASPTAGQIYTMNNTSSQSISNSDSIFRLYDPGGTSNYINNTQGNVIVNLSPGSSKGVKISSAASDWGFGTGDTLWISEQTFPSCRDDYEYRFTSGSANPGDFVLKFAYRFIFRSNADNNNNKGFNFTLTRLYNNENDVLINTAGPALVYNTSNNSFIAGSNSEALSNSFVVGTNSRAKLTSVAIGTNTQASGFNTTSIGIGSIASGNGAVAIGTSYNINMGGTVYPEARGAFSTAFGSGAQAIGDLSVAVGSYCEAQYAAVAFGAEANATGNHSIAVGRSVTASGVSSSAMGYNSSAIGSLSTALGNGSTAVGTYSTALGFGTRAEGDYSLALGWKTESNAYGGTVVGMYNDPFGVAGSSVDLNPVFMVGNGDNPTSRSNALVVSKNGNTGIGTDFPLAKLQLSGGYDASLSSNSGYMIIGSTSGTNLVFDNNEIIARNSGSNSTLFLQNTGGALEIGGTAAKPGGGSWAATSDARLKQNVKPYSDGLQQLMKINPVYYQYNSLSGYDTQKQYVGVLAQEIREVAPYMVGTFTKDNAEYLNVDNTAMTYMLINAVKELSKQNEELKARLDILENQSKK